MSRPPGRLLVVPVPLDFGVAAADADIAELLPLSVLRAAARLDRWIAENAKSTRAFLKRVDRAVALQRPLQEVSIVELPRAPKGGGRTATPADVAGLLAPALAGDDVGLASEAGLAAVADPGAAVVAAAHAANVRVVALPGASAITLAIAASGLNGQSFAFVGYLPTDAAQRATRIGELEALSRRLMQTQSMIETPYRNGALLQALLAHLQPSTLLAVSVGLTLAGETSRSAAVAEWRKRPPSLPADVPAVFSFLAR